MAANLTLWDSDYQGDKILRWALTVCSGFSQTTNSLTVIFVFFWPTERGALPLPSFVLSILLSSQGLSPGVNVSAGSQANVIFPCEIIGRRAVAAVGEQW